MKPDRYERELEKLRGRLCLKEAELSIYKAAERFYSGSLDAESLSSFLAEALRPFIASESVFVFLKGCLEGLQESAHLGGSFARRGGKKRALYLLDRVVERGRLFCDQTEGVMAAPVKIGRKVCGAIGIEVCGHQGEAKRLLRLVATQLSSMLEKRRVLNTLEEKVAQLSALHEVGSLLVSTLEEKVVRERAISSITGLIGAEAGSLLLVDRDRKELYFEVALGEKGEKVKTIRLKLGEGIAGWVAKHGKPLIVNDVSKDRRFQSKVDRQSKFRTRSIICVPVRIKNDIIGVLEGINKIEGEFTEDDLSILELFSNQVAIALDNARLYKEIRDTFYATSEALADAIEKRDPYTGGHTERVLQYSMAIAEELGLDEKTRENVRFAAVLHDVGKIGIDDCILRKQDRLDHREQDTMKRHPNLGAEILSHIPQLKDVVPGILYHHERIDGRGYPEGLEGEEIPIVARIIAVADAYDAMTTTRSYRKALPVDKALRELRRCAGTQFDKEVVEAFIKALRRGLAR